MGFVLGIVGAVLVLVAIKYASDVLGDPKIFNNMLYAVVIGIVGLVVGVVASRYASLAQMAFHSSPAVTV